MTESIEDFETAVKAEFRRRISQNQKTWKSQQRLWFSEKTNLYDHLYSSFLLRCHTHPLFYRLNGLTRESLPEFVSRIVTKKIGPFPTTTKKKCPNPPPTSTSPAP